MIQLLLLIFLAITPALKASSFVVVIPSYNNEKYCEKNLHSVFSQTYHNYRVIYIDDCSSDSTYEKVKAFIENHHQQDRVSLIRNEKRRLAVENLYHAIHSCNDNEIIVMLDGDDWFAHENVLQRLNTVYSDPNVWMTYGTYIRYPHLTRKGRKYGSPVPIQVLRTNLIRKFTKDDWRMSHLKTCYASLFKKIKQEDLMWNGEFLPSCYDIAIMVPMAEMAGTCAHFIPEVLYVYNVTNPINDEKVDPTLQGRCKDYILSLPPYQPLQQLNR